jgi:dienelactone hydrolase
MQHIRRHVFLVAAALLLTAAAAQAKTMTKKVAYAIGDTKFEGVLVWDGSVRKKRPAILMAPNFMGVTQNAIDKATLLSGKRYVIFIADMYGAGIRPKTAQEAGAASMTLRKNTALHRDRVNRAFDVMLAEAGKRNLIDMSKTAAIGFCFGGGNVLELARSGRDTKAVVSFHGSLTTAHPDGAKNVKASVLVLHGADDPIAPQTDRVSLEQELIKGGVKDWQIVTFGGAVHSFTNPDAKAAGQAHYDARATKRAYAMMHDLLAEKFR